MAKVVTKASCHRVGTTEMTSAVIAMTTTMATGWTRPLPTAGNRWRK